MAHSGIKGDASITLSSGEEDLEEQTLRSYYSDPQILGWNTCGDYEVTAPKTGRCKRKHEDNSHLHVFARKKKKFNKFYLVEDNKLTPIFHSNKFDKSGIYSVCQLNVLNRSMPVDSLIDDNLDDNVFLYKREYKMDFSDLLSSNNSINNGGDDTNSNPTVDNYEASGIATDKISLPSKCFEDVIEYDPYPQESRGLNTDSLNPPNDVNEFSYGVIEDSQVIVTNPLTNERNIYTISQPIDFQLEQNSRNSQTKSLRKQKNHKSRSYTTRFGRVLKPSQNQIYKSSSLSEKESSPLRNTKTVEKESYTAKLGYTASEPISLLNPAVVEKAKRERRIPDEYVCHTCNKTYLGNLMSRHLRINPSHETKFSHKKKSEITLDNKTSTFDYFLQRIKSIPEKDRLNHIVVELSDIIRKLPYLGKKLLSSNGLNGCNGSYIYSDCARLLGISEGSYELPSDQFDDLLDCNWTSSPLNNILLSNSIFADLDNRHCNIEIFDNVTHENVDKITLPQNICDLPTVNLSDLITEDETALKVGSLTDRQPPVLELSFEDFVFPPS